MNSARPQTLARRLVVSFSAAALFMATASTTSAQAIPDLFTKVETLTLSDGTPAVGNVSIGGETAVVSGTGEVHVFEREPGGDHWAHTATLVGGAGPVATDGQTIVVGVLVFERVPRTHTWQEVARLTGDQNSDSFGSSVAVSGTTIVIGAPFGEYVPGPPGGIVRGLGLVYVFERNLGGAGAWGEAARLRGSPPPNPQPEWIDQFGYTVAIDRDTVLVGASTPFFFGFPGTPPSRVYAFSRHDGGPNAWGLVATPLAEPGVPSESVPRPTVSISGDTAIIGRPSGGTLRGPGSAAIFQRDQGGPNAWGAVARLGPSQASFYYRMNIGGDWAALMLSEFGEDLFEGVSVFGRHQGGADAWGEVQRIGLPVSSFPSSLTISGDTILVGNLFLSATERTPIDVYVADTDRDGVSDGIDSCPRDPLNNIAGRCQRASAAHPVLDELIAQGDVTSETSGRRQIVTATFTNTSETAVQNPFFEVTELTGRNVLLNGDAGRGRSGATLSPDVGDGILSPGESMTVTFEIRLRTRNPFQFFVTLHGDPVPAS